MSQSQANIQGIYSERVDHINEFRRVMGDIRIDLHPLAQEVVIIFNKKTADVYNDVTVVEEERVTKRVLFSKQKDLEFVQQTFTDFLIEEEQEMPYIVRLTTTCLPRQITADDQILVGDDLYTISKVRLTNRTQDTIQELLVYNERGNIEGDFDFAPDEDDNLYEEYDEDNPDNLYK